MVGRFFETQCTQFVQNSVLDWSIYRYTNWVWLHLREVGLYHQRALEVCGPRSRTNFTGWLTVRDRSAHDGGTLVRI